VFACSLSDTGVFKNINVHDMLEVLVMRLTVSNGWIQLNCHFILHYTASLFQCVSCVQNPVWEFNSCRHEEHTQCDWHTNGWCCCCKRSSAIQRWWTCLKGQVNVVCPHDYRQNSVTTSRCIRVRFCTIVRFLILSYC